MTKTLLEKNDIQQIVANIVFTKHALKRAKERLNITKTDTLVDMIQKSSIGWNNVDKTLNIVLNETSYIILKKDKDKFVAITIKGESLNGVSIAEKIYLAMRNISFKKRKNYDNTKTNRSPCKDTKETASPNKREQRTTYRNQSRNNSNRRFKSQTDA